MKIVATVKGLSLGLWATQRGEDRGESMFTFAISPLQTGQAGTRVRYDILTNAISRTFIFRQPEPRGS